MKGRVMHSKTIDTSQFSQADWKRLADYVSILIDIDRKMQQKASRNSGVRS